jgi:uncharacterized OB-fold protein
VKNQSFSFFPLSTHHSLLFLMQPEISRRCPGCGAAIRGSVSYCPHCGVPTQRAANVDGVVEAQELAEARDESVNMEEETEIASTPLMDEGSISGIEQGQDVSAISAGVENRPRAKVYQEPRVERGNKRRRMTNAARGAMEDKLMPRVEKMRQSSAVMFDEAAIDPSLRFVLIAAALFAIFVVLLFISLLR